LPRIKGAAYGVVEIGKDGTYPLPDGRPLTQRSAIPRVSISSCRIEPLDEQAGLID
jgi:hypothetical protein